MRGRLILLAVVAGLGCSVAVASGDEFAVSLRLRPGYDTNPTLRPGTPSGSAFLTAEAAVAVGHSAGSLTLGVVAESTLTRYDGGAIEPLRRQKLAISAAGPAEGPLSVRSQATIADFSSYELRTSDIGQSVRAEASLTPARLFVTAELGHMTLNQTNAIFQDFLPEPHRILRGTIIPGASIGIGGLELGATVSLSARRYAREFDDFGYRRDNERIQPFLFARYRGRDLNLFASVSRLVGDWHDPDFTDVRETLFDASASYRIDPLELELTASRTAAETTFPISPVVIETGFGGRLRWRISQDWAASAQARWARSAYLDSSFSASGWTYGGELTWTLSDRLTLGMDIARLDQRLISGERARGFSGAVSLTTRLAPHDGRAGRPPAEAGSASGSAAATAMAMAAMAAAAAEQHAEHAALAGRERGVDDQPVRPASAAEQRADDTALARADAEAEAEAVALRESRADARDHQSRGGGDQNCPHGCFSCHAPGQYKSR